MVGTLSTFVLSSRRANQLPRMELNPTITEYSGLWLPMMHSFKIWVYGLVVVAGHRDNFITPIPLWELGLYFCGGRVEG